MTITLLLLETQGPPRPLEPGPHAGVHMCGEEPAFQDGVVGVAVGAHV